MKFTTPYAAATAMVMALAPQAVLAQDTAGEIATSLATQVTSLSVLLTVIIFVSGVGIAFAGLLKFKAQSDNPNDPSNKKSTAFILIFVGAAMVAIPELLGSGISTVFGSGATQTNATGGFDSL